MLINPLGNTAHTLALDEQKLRVVKRGSTQVLPLNALISPPIVRRGMLGATLMARAAGYDEVILRGAVVPETEAFAEYVRDAWVEHNVSSFEREEDRFAKLHAAICELSGPTFYPAACRIEPLLNAAKALDVELLSKLQPDAIGPQRAADVALVRSFVVDPEPARQRAIAFFVQSELDRWKDFFDNIESKPLTPEQRLSIVVDEDATLVLAGAGSGKTSVITAKAAYLVKAGLRRPDEILLLAFAKNAAKEMSDRVEARSGVPIMARTFHALALNIIGTVEGSKPALADHATDDIKFVNLIKDILRDLVRAMSNVARAIIRWFSHFLVEPKTEWDFKTKHAFYRHMEQQDLRTLQGEKVKSYEELQIANWLYESGIEYEYEPVYEHELPASGRRDYCPDFRLIESGVYIEHFGVRRRNMPDGTEQLVTAPFVDRQEYLASMAWKREVHFEHETTLIETYSYERQEGRLLASLAEKLVPYVLVKPRPLEAIFDRVVEMHQVDQFSQLLGTFLRKFKGGGYSLSDCGAKSDRFKMGERARAFLSVFGPVFSEYEKRLAGRIDFEDMVLRAARYVESGQYVSSFRHILLDEFQDISQGRARLVKALKAQHPDARIFAVGDDWQSIFRFAGSDIHLMRQFSEEFGGQFNGQTGMHRVVDLGRTFRSVDQIAYAAKSFVLKNPAQIDKKIVSSGSATELAIRVFMVAKDDIDIKVHEVLAAFSTKIVEADGPLTVLILGRYRFLEPNMADLQRSFPKLRISFKTVHASKGLEADHVVLLNADSGRMGFPSEIVDDPLLTLVSPEPEPFEHAEERRLWYVAMTRARHTFTILASKSRPSPFVSELLDDPAYTIAPAPGAASEAYECRECGGRLLDVRGKDGRMWYRCEHLQHCGNLVPACSRCGTASPRRMQDSATAQCTCGASFPACPACESGWLVERRGRFGSFLGCVRYPGCTAKARTAPIKSGSSARSKQGRHPPASA